MDGPLLVGVRNLDGVQHPLRKPGRAVPLRRQFRLHAPDHDRIELLAVGRRAAGEPLVVEQFEQRRKALRVAVVRRGREEQLVFKVRHEQAKGLGPQRVRGVPAHARRGAVVGLVHDQQVELAGEGWLVRPRQEFPEQPQRSLPLEEVDAGDEPGEVVPRVDVDAPAAAQHASSASSSRCGSRGRTCPASAPATAPGARPGRRSESSGCGAG